MGPSADIRTRLMRTLASVMDSGEESEDEREGLLELMEEFILWISSIDKESWNPLEKCHGYYP